MVRRKQDPDYGCPIEVTLDVIGGKWKGTVLYRLVEGTARFNELRRIIPGITHRVLTMQLRELERDGVIYRRTYPEVPPRVEYRLTEFGLSLKPLLALMEEWGEKYRVLTSSSASQTRTRPARRAATGP